MGGLEPQILEGSTFGEDGVTREVHATAQVNVGFGFVGYFASNYLTIIWRRVPMFGRNYINGSVEWLGVPDLLRTNGPAWTSNLLDPQTSWGYIWFTTNLNWVSQSGGAYGSFPIPWSRLICVLPVYHCSISENLRAAERRVCDDILQGNCLVRMQSPTTHHNPILTWQVNLRDDD